MSSLVVLLLLPLQAAAGPPPDSVEAIRREARRAEQEFERLVRRLAPVDFGAGSGGECDEIVGRFCLRFDSSPPPEPKDEAPRVTNARRAAIEALRRAFSFQAAEFTTSGPLVRYLVEDDRAAEAVSAARTYAALTSDSIWGPLLLGFALHAAGEDTAAERLFDDGLARMEPDDREKILNLDWLLGPEDRKAYRRLDTERKRSFERRLWQLSDPLLLMPGNARRAEHIFRHVYGRILARAPVVHGMVRWGDDLQQLTVRYGVPYSRTRTASTMTRESSIIEHFDPNQLADVPEDLLTRGPPPPPPPGETWALANPRARSGHASGGVRKLVPLPHQVTLFPAPTGWTVRVDAALPLDSIAAGAAGARTATTGLWLLDSAAVVAAERTASGVAVRDTIPFRLDVPASAGSYVYGAEVFERDSQLAGRARYAIDVPERGPGIALSDPLIADAFGDGERPAHRDDDALRPLTDLTLTTGDTVGLYAEVHGLAVVNGESAYRVELTIRPADRASLPSRIASWLGRRLGISSPALPPRLAWTATAQDGGPATIAVDLQLDGVDDGLQVITLRVRDEIGTSEAESSRLVRVVRGSRVGR